VNFLELAKERYSVREYKTDKIADETILQILEAGRVAPTARNYQPYKFLVINSEESLEKLKKGANVYGAPLAIIICGDRDGVWVRPFDNKTSLDIDTTIATTHMMLQAQALGLGTCWINYFNPEIIRSEFNFPDNIEPINILAVGYSDSEPESPDRHSTARKPLDSFLVYNSF